MTLAEAAGISPGTNAYLVGRPGSRQELDTPALLIDLDPGAYTAIVEGVAQALGQGRFLLDGLVLLADRLAFAGQRRLLSAQVNRFDQPDIGRDGVARLQ